MTFFESWVNNNSNEIFESWLNNNNNNRTLKVWINDNNNNNNKQILKVEVIIIIIMGFLKSLG